MSLNMENKMNIEIAQIVAMSRNRCIGKNNDLPWHIKEDLQHFKKMTTQTEQPNAPIQGIMIMGRKTFESMGKNPLPKRLSLVVTQQKDYATHVQPSDKLHIFHDIHEAVEYAKSEAKRQQLNTIWIIGGEQIFCQTLDITNRIELTLVDTQIEQGDAFFPPIPVGFKQVSHSEKKYDEKSQLVFEFQSFIRA